MERIQMALEKARAKRASSAGAAPTASDPAQPPSQTANHTATTAATAKPAVRNGPASATITEIAPPAPAPTAAPAPAPGELSAEIRTRWETLPVFSPKPSLMAHHRLIGFSGGREAGPIDMMRTKILQEMRKNGWRRLAITSPNPGCGKTTTALNLAFSLGRQANQRTVVADLDMRRPGMARMLGLQAGHRFARVIAGEVPAQEHMVRYGTNLAFGTSETPARNPAELLQGASIGPALTQIETDYAATVMIFDMPPMMMSDDMMAFAPHVDCVLLLAGAETTSMDDLDRCERELAGVTNVLGVVLNKCRYMEPGYGYGYY